MARYYDDKDIIWRTIGGRRIPIRAGQSLSQAMKESGKFNKKSKKEVGEETKKFEESKVENEYINKVSNAKNDKELAEADKYYKDNTGKNWDDGKKEREKEFHYAGEELYSDDPNRFGDTLKKHNEKMNPSKSRDEVVKQLDKDVKESSNNNSSAREKELADKVKHYAVKDGKTVSWTDEEEAKRIYNEDYGANTELRFASDEYMQKRGDSLKQFWKKYNENQVLGKPFDFDEEYKNIEKNITQDDRNYIQDIRKRYKNNAPQSQSRDDVVKQLNEEAKNWKSEDGGVTRRETDKGTNYIQGTKKADGTSEYTRTDYDKNGNEISSKTYKSLDEAKSDDSDWRSQIKSNNAKLEKDVTDLQNQINEYRTKSAQSNDALERYQYLKEAEKLQDKYYQRFRENERANAKLKKEEPNEKYEYVDTYATYKDKFNDTWGKDGSSDKVVSASMYTNDEFMEHLEDANWHSERKQLLDANLTNKELEYIKNKTKVSAWGVENLTGKEQVSKLIQESKNQNNNISTALRQKAYQKYLKEHPGSKMTFNQFKKMEEE